jgi:diaminopimelate epimerase
MKVPFTKMQSLGNDFVMLNGIRQDIHITEPIARHLADRRFGIGCDQILVAESEQGRENGGQGLGFQLRIFNSDGSEVGQCGNGARCFAQYLHDQGLVNENNIAVRTMTTEVMLHLKEDGTVTVDMGVPKFDPKQIPLNIDDISQCYEVDLATEKIEFSAMSLGNPHCVISVESVQNANVESIGPEMENNRLFPDRVNVGFRQIVSRERIMLRVHERGAGETLGCGSGACAAVATGIQGGLLEDNVEVELPGGIARVSWQGGETQIFLNGSVHKVFEGTIEL